jgi:hypothetical protein
MESAGSEVSGVNEREQTPIQVTKATIACFG